METVGTHEHMKPISGKLGPRTYQTHHTQETVQFPYLDPQTQRVFNAVMVVPPPTCHLTTQCVHQGTDRLRTPN